MTSALANLTQEQHNDEVIKHALQIRSAWSLNNYRKFYELYERSPKMSMHLIDWFLERERKSHLKLMMKVYVTVLSFTLFQFIFLTLLAPIHLHILVAVIKEHDSKLTHILLNGREA